jgi:hypothetical protein
MPLVAAGVGVLALAAVLSVAALHIDHPGSPRLPSAATARLGRPTAQHAGGAHAGHLRTAGAHSAPAGAKRSAGAKGTDRPSPTARGTANPKIASSPARDLAVPASFGPTLRQAWVAADPGKAGLTTADVLSTAGSVFYAEQPSISTYWAISSFAPTAHAEALAATSEGKAMLSLFGPVVVFEKIAGHGWSFVASAPQGTCSKAVPGPVYNAWGICASGPG